MPVGGQDAVGVGECGDRGMPAGDPSRVGLGLDHLPEPTRAEDLPDDRPPPGDGRRIDGFHVHQRNTSIAPA